MNKTKYDEKNSIKRSRVRWCAYKYLDMGDACCVVDGTKNKIIMNGEVSTKIKSRFIGFNTGMTMEHWACDDERVNECSRHAKRTNVYDERR